MTNWKKEIEARMKLNYDRWIDVEAFTPVEAFAPTSPWWLVEFDDEFGGIQVPPFTLWTKHFVYFPICYDELKWCGSVPRNPCDIATALVI